MVAALVRSSTRLEAYSDAIFAIVATVMIVPISHIEIPDYQPLEVTFMKEIFPKLVVYIFTFLVVCNTWSGHVWLFETIEKVDEMLVMFNLALMMVTTFLPFTFTVLGTYPQNTLAVLLFCGIIMLVGLVQFICILHAFLHPELLELDIRESASMKSQRNKMFASALSPVVWGFVAAVISPFSPIASDFILLLILFGNAFRHIGFAAYTKIMSYFRERLGEQPHTDSLESSQFRDRIMGKMFSKERIECFSDGVFSIVATLLILDICSDDIPGDADIKRYGSLSKALNAYSPIFLAYAGCFVMVGLLWHVHHSMLHYLRDFSKLMVIFNELCLLSIGVTPLMFSIITKYTEEEIPIANNESVAIQLASTALFFAGLFQMAVWITALFSQDRLMSPEGRYGGKDHAYITAKLTVFPLLSLFIYCLSFASYSIKTEAFNALQIGAIGIFFLLGLAYSCIKKCKGRQSLGESHDIWVSQPSSPFAVQRVDSAEIESYQGI